MFIETLMSNPIFGLRFIVIIIISICLHELAHGLAAISQGDDTPYRLGHITMNPVVHMGWPSLILLFFIGIAWGQMPVNPRKFRHLKFSSIFVSASGPLCNFALGLLCILMILAIRENLLVFNLLSDTFFYLAAYINFMLFIFNLLPIPPLDGFHVASEIFPSLKSLANSPFGYMAIMIVFLGGFSSVLGYIVNGMMCLLGLCG
ncbi:MAG: site-2 protease family protein [Cyanobacteria bacterium P01_G01_bin.49]